MIKILIYFKFKISSIRDYIDIRQYVSFHKLSKLIINILVKILGYKLFKFIR